MLSCAPIAQLDAAQPFTNVERRRKTMTDALQEAQRAKNRASSKRLYHSSEAERERVISARTKWRAENPELAAEQRRALYLRNKEKVANQSKQWREKNKQRIAEKAAAWKAANRDKLAATCRAYQAAKIRAIPFWADDELDILVVSEAYALAKIRTQILGTPHEVDHIVPLQSNLVCGLHCAANVRVIPNALNRAKGNRFWPGMPA